MTLSSGPVDAPCLEKSCDNSTSPPIGSGAITRGLACQGFPESEIPEGHNLTDQRPLDLESREAGSAGKAGSINLCLAARLKPCPDVVTLMRNPQ